MAAVWSLLMLLSSFFAARGVDDKHSNGTIGLGYSLSPLTPPTSLASPSDRFAFANRDDLPLHATATLTLNEKGLLLSSGVRGENRVIASPNDSAVSVFSASMLDSGNFVLYNKVNHTIWESFEHPTDTLLGGQALLTNHELISSSSENDHSSGRFHLRMQLDGNLVLYPLNVDDAATTAYWATGFLQLINNTDSSIYLEINYRFYQEVSYNDHNENTTTTSNDGIVHSATLDVDGNFQLYTHQFEPSGGFRTSRVSRALKDYCKVVGFCGINSYCTFNDDRAYCACLPGTDFIDPQRDTLGCKRNYSETHCKGGKDNIPLYNITPLQNIVWTTGIFYSEELMSMSACSQTCLEDCNCEAAQFSGGVCRKQKLPLWYLLRQEGDNDVSSTVFLKMGIRSLEADDGTVPHELKPQIKRKDPTLKILLLTFSLVACSCALLAISGVFIFKFRVLRYKRLLEIGNLGLTGELTLTSFSYNELKRATNGFKEELGRNLIAVKRLEKFVEEGEREFQAEMRAIGRAHHKNLVRLLGYCAEDSKRVLVYEYMGNGSLADLLFKSRQRPDWDERTRIALDVARGILYLHEECETPIIHCDIKPQNILMDDYWRAKISDFGLAKLLMGDHTRTFTVVRGTRGYMAPEWHKNIPISAKAGVYSYGIVLLETVFCRRNLDTTVSNPEEIILSILVYKCLVEKKLDKLVLGEEVDKKSLERMVMVALWCIQDEPALRPSIKTVVMMLEGITDICIPPCPTASSI
ncbi:hypothetical protein ES332_D04G034100v1 [Gossypium tomentosum]|uniref:Receptor-like serine/threonine-protein kinase n=1 Tax=Gossypium tomentosum TaxID=34277 RepID=A0A5D2L8S4_GOSTO|nr:hypothetical protein ES332_D04G034100v1 [Gossypium tomentosum]